MQRNRDAYQAWLLGEALLLALLGGALAVFLIHWQAHSTYALPHLKLVLQTVGAVASGLVALLAGVRFANERRRFDLLLCLGFFLSFASTLAFGASLMLFSSLLLVFTPLLGNVEVSPGDFLRVLGYAVICIGVWRAIKAAEFGRAVSDERSRLAREIHDGLAQYLFAVSTHATMLEQGGSAEELAPKIKQAAGAAQQEARFAILALSSAGGSAPFDAALQRYVELLTADGALDVELEIDPRMRLDPDEQIELFRIVQEGLANVRRHARARLAEVRIEERDGRRVVTIVDDGEGFERDDAGGQGLRNIRARIASIGAALALR